MKINDFYNSKVINSHFDYRILRTYFEHSTLINFSYDEDNIAKNTRVEFKTHIKKKYNDREDLMIFSVWFDKSPVMLCIYGFHFSYSSSWNINHYITDKEKYSEMVEYLEKITYYRKKQKIYDKNTDIEELNFICEDDMSVTLFDNDFQTKFKVGDIVMFNENINDNNFIIEIPNIKGKIIEVNPKSSIATYIIEVENFKTIHYHRIAPKSENDYEDDDDDDCVMRRIFQYDVGVVPMFYVLDFSQSLKYSKNKDEPFVKGIFKIPFDNESKLVLVEDEDN